MSHWKKSSLESVAQVIMGSSPSSNSYNDENIGMPLIQGNADIKFRLAKPRTYTKEITKLCKSGDIIMTVRAPVGAIAKSLLDACIGRGVCAIRPQSIDKEYLYQYLISKESGWSALEQGSTFTAINTKDVKQLSIEYPASKDEQELISTILSTIDKKISLIEQKTFETNKIKIALMQKLFHEGIGTQDNEGNWIPHVEYKYTALGKIPKSWAIKNLVDISLIEDGDRGKGYPKQNDFMDSGYCLFLSAKNVTRDGFKFENTQFISRDKHNDLRKGVVHKNDIVITTRGTVGNFGIFKNSENYNAVRINSGMAIIRCHNEKEANYLHSFMHSSIFKKQVGKLSFGSAQPQLTIKQVKSLSIFIPTEPEAELITNILDLIDSKINLLEKQKSETQLMKRGLMQKLLTGEWRVSVDSLDEVAA